MPNFANLTSISTGVLEQFVFPEKVKEVNFGLKYAGYIKVPTDNLYTFYVNSDDGGLLLLDDELIINNDGLHAPAELPGTIMLRSGYHKIKALFFQKGGGKAFDVKIESPELSKQVIPAEMLFRE